MNVGKMPTLAPPEGDHPSTEGTQDNLVILGEKEEFRVERFFGYGALELIHQREGRNRLRCDLVSGPRPPADTWVRERLVIQLWQAHVGVNRFFIHTTSPFDGGYRVTCSLAPELPFDLAKVEVMLFLWQRNASGKRIWVRNTPGSDDLFPEPDHSSGHLLRLLTPAP